MPQRKGRGFFGAAPTAEDEAARQREVASLLPPRRAVIQELPLERIRPNPFQARQRFTNLEELSAAIQAQGFITRLRVRPDPVEDGYFQLAFGERRLRAARLAGLTEVPCEVAEHTDDELFEIGLAENIQRRDLEPLEEARAFHIFIEGRGYSIRRLAERIGKDKSYVQDRLALLRVPEDVQRMIEQRPDTLRIAREIGKLATAEERRPLIDDVTAGRLNTEDVRNIVRTIATPATQATEASDTGTSAEPATLDALGDAMSIQGRPGVPGTPLPSSAPDTLANALAMMPKQLTAGPKQSTETKKGRASAARLQREMGTVRVILARWQHALPEMSAVERAKLATCIDELLEVSTGLSARLHSSGELDK